MNIRQQLLNKNSRNNADFVQAHVVAHRESLVELMACFFSDEKVVAQRAAMVVGNLGRAEPACLKPWWSSMVDAAEDPVHQAVRRAVTRYFSELTLAVPEKLEARLVELLGTFVANPKENVAIAAFSMTFVADRAQRYPDAAQHLQRTLVRLIPAGSPGFQNRGRKILLQLEKK